MRDLEPLESRSTPAVYAASGAYVYQLTNSGQVADVLQPFADTRVPVGAVAVADGLLWVGAGEGGGPHVKAFGLKRHDERVSVFVGDPERRDGVALAALPANTLRAADDLIQARLDRLPPLPGTVTVFDGPLTDLPEFAHLRGVETGTTVDPPGRTYDAVDGTALPGHMYVRAGMPRVAYHEYGHLLAFHQGLPLDADAHERFALEYEGTP